MAKGKGRAEASGDRWTDRQVDCEPNVDMPDSLPKSMIFLYFCHSLCLKNHQHEPKLMSIFEEKTNSMTLEHKLACFWRRTLWEREVLL